MTTKYLAAICMAALLGGALAARAQDAAPAAPDNPDKTTGAGVIAPNAPPPEKWEGAPSTSAQSSVTSCHPDSKTGQTCNEDTSKTMTPSVKDRGVIAPTTDPDKDINLPTPNTPDKGMVVPSPGGNIAK